MTPEPVPPAPPPQKQGPSAVTIVLAIVGALVACCVFGVIAAVAVPNFLRFNARAKQVECKANLAQLFTLQATTFAEKNDYGDTFAEVGFAPVEPRRYTYLMGDAVLAPTTGPSVREDELPAIAGDTLPGVTGTCPDDCEFVAACAANLDGDEALDTWSVSSKARTAPDGSPISAGTVFHDLDDLGR